MSFPGIGTMLNYSVDQLRKFNNCTTPSCISVIKQLGLLRRPRYIHRGSRRKLVYLRNGSSPLPLYRGWTHPGCGVFCNTPVDCETGKSCTFNPGVTKPETIEWKYSKTVDNVIKVLDWDPQITKPNNTFWFPRLVNRATLDPKTAALTILQVKKEDSGFYTCEIQMKGALTYYHYKVEVFDPVPKPKVKCVLNGPVVTALLCSVDPQVQATIEWQIPNEGKRGSERIDIPEGHSED
ncbi:uncharacterized protein LOC134324589 [Trichomycterus rosablanca]|uniref:uncharacterized protein LOC134324589 n=1 Tax=Trichomycterus rosablanca TaxID=2290929 RepID=UPI002F352B60